ncbi:MAG TPA: glycogen synthase GlgA [Dokdonella sp.]|nr:glycogen synthase GlgA [Dokdonella sp.]
MLQVASEMYPLAKTGGLADVCGALPKALVSAGADVRVIMPAYPSALDGVADLRLEVEFGEMLGPHPVRLLRGCLRDGGLVVWLVDCPTLYQRPGTPYLDANGDEWPDNALRYGVLCHVASRVALGFTGNGWAPDVVHCHDWHTGLVPLLLRRSHARPRSVFTVHNAAFQGNFPLATAALLELPRDGEAFAGFEFYGQLSFLKCGLAFADKVTTVSPTYARELATPEFGCGLEGLFASRAADFSGIMNGIDTEVWNPATDPFLVDRYSAGDPSGKLACKASLQAELGLRRDVAAPVAIFASRVTTQKMADVLLGCLPALMQRNPRLQFAMLGHGDRALETGYAEFARAYAGRAAVDIGYRESSAHRLHAGADFLLHGSRFEPCGLAQLYAMRYGAIPIVRRIGGLADSVVDAGSDTRGHATGFVFDAATGDALEEAVQRCLAVYGAPDDAWRAMRLRAMASDFGWKRSAQAYLDLYAQALQACAPASDGRTAVERGARALVRDGVRPLARGRGALEWSRRFPSPSQRTSAHAGGSHETHAQRDQG